MRRTWSLLGAGATLLALAPVGASQLSLPHAEGAQTDTVLLGGEPLSKASSPWPSAEHSLAPSSTWADASAPLPTNAWWQNLVLGTGENVINSLPYTLRARADGLHLCHPVKVPQPTYVYVATLDNLIMGAVEDLGSRRVVDHDELSVTVGWGQEGARLTAPIVRGMPYVTGIYEGLRPKLSTQHAVLKFNGMPLVVGKGSTASRFTLELNNGQTWVLYSSSPLTLTPLNLSQLDASGPFDGSLRAALLVPGQGELLDKHAARIPTGGEVQASSRGDEATLRFTWETAVTGDLLMMTLPHHRDILEGARLLPHTMETIKGEMRAVVGERWVLREDLTTIAWSAPAGVDPSLEPELRLALNGDVNQDVHASDTYFGGKQLAKLGRLAVIADELGERALADTYRDKLQDRLDPWLNGTNPVPLVYDRSWGGLVSVDGISSPQAAFGQGYYNDHHFHFGYFVYAAAALAKERTDWRDAKREEVLHFVRDIANPSARDPHYPVTRNMDWFVGHSWAAGLFEFGDSRNQESTSEAVNAWYSVYLWGLVNDDARLSDLGRLMLATEIRSAQRYWQITSESDLYNPPFADNKVVGVLWSTKVGYETFFGNEPEFIHGIQMLPFTPISEELLRQDWISQSYPLFSENYATTSDGWRGFMVMAKAIFDSQAAWNEAQALNGYDDGNTRANTLYWIATRP